MFAFGVDGPGGVDGEAGADEGGGEGVPRLDAFVGEHDGEHAVVAQHAVHLAEGGGHLALVVLFGQLLLLLHAALAVVEARRIGDRFVVLVCQRVCEKTRQNVADRAFQPDIEKVGEFGIIDIVVIGWVHRDISHGRVL